MPSLRDLLELTDEQAQSQWSRILERQPRGPRVRYTPVEIILCYGLFRLVRPHDYGGQTADQAPRIVHDLSRLFVRSPASITSKMKNLDGSLPHAGPNEMHFFRNMGEDESQYRRLYNRVLLAARKKGIDDEQLPDFLYLEGEDTVDLLGQNELSNSVFDVVVEAQAKRLRASLSGDATNTTRLAQQQVRLGQDQFARSVLANFEYSCGFCGFAPRSLPRHHLLEAAHIKSWADCDDVERLDPRNGVAACGVHHAAFDAGLITVDRDLRIRIAEPLAVSIRDDPGVKRYFGRALRPRLLLPSGALQPQASYLRWHRIHQFRGDATV